METGVGWFRGGGGGGEDYQQGVIMERTIYVIINRLQYFLVNAVRIKR